MNSIYDNDQDQMDADELEFPELYETLGDRKVRVCLETLRAAMAALGLVREPAAVQVDWSWSE